MSSGAPSPSGLGKLAPLYRVNMAKEMFCSTVDHLGLQQHLLAVLALTLIDAVQAGIRFFQIKQESRQTMTVRSVEKAQTERAAIV